MAGHLSNSGHAVTVYNRTASKAQDWCRKYKGEIAETPAAAAREADIVFSCVGNDDDVRALLLVSWRQRLLIAPEDFWMHRYQAGRPEQRTGS